MATTNVRARNLRRTHEGAMASPLKPEEELRRSVMSCLLWENEFYECGEQIADRIASLVPRVDPRVARLIASRARTESKLRHVPLWIAKAMVESEAHRPLVASTLADIIQRPDELTEFLSLYWKGGRRPLAAQVKKGLARAFSSFDSYQLAKYDRSDTIKLRDVMFLCHPKPENTVQARDWEKLAKGTLSPPDTWEVALSTGEDKRQAWERLLSTNKLGALALLRNLRNMEQAGVTPHLIQSALAKMKVDRVLPFRFISAAKHAPQLEPWLEEAMYRCCASQPKLPGSTVILVDVSGSMVGVPVSQRSKVDRLDVACGLAILARELCNDVRILTFSAGVASVPPRRGFALRDAIVDSQPHWSTDLAGAVTHANELGADRLIMISDEQAHGRGGMLGYLRAHCAIPDPAFDRAYMINIASNQNGVGYGKWTHIDGWSESVLTYIREVEQMRDE